MSELERNFVQVKSISKHLLCSFCLEVFTNPMRVKCQHTFCYQCIYEWIKNNDNCPECRQEIRNKGGFQTDILAQKLIDDLLVFCVNKQICQWRGKLKELANHVAQCSVNNDTVPKWLKEKEMHNINILSKNFSEQKLQLNELLQERMNEEVNNQSLMSRVFQKSQNNQNLVSSIFETQVQNNQFSEFTNLMNDNYDNEQMDAKTDEKIKKLVEQKFLLQIIEQNKQNQKVNRNNSQTYDQLKSQLKIDNDDDFEKQLEESRRSLKTIKESQLDHEDSLYEEESKIQKQIHQKYNNNNLAQSEQNQQDKKQSQIASILSSPLQQSTQISQEQFNELQLEDFNITPEDLLFNIQYFRQQSQLNEMQFQNQNSEMEIPQEQRRKKQNPRTRTNFKVAEKVRKQNQQ